MGVIVLFLVCLYNSNLYEIHTYQVESLLIVILDTLSQKKIEVFTTCKAYTKYFVNEMINGVKIAALGCSRESWAKSG